MALPEKNYYSLCDVGERWKVLPQDVRYYAENGLLEIQTWLPEIIVKIFRNKKMEDGQIAPVQIGVSDFKGYAVVETDALREIFRHNTHAVIKFKTPCIGDFIKMFDPRTPFMLAINDLVISKCERDRFERECGIEVANTAHQIKISPPPPSFSGRPSVMHKIEKEFYARAASGKLLPTLAGESRHLHAWAKTTIQDEQTPSWRGIANALRVKYKHENTMRVDVVLKNQVESVV